MKAASLGTLSAAVNKLEFSVFTHLLNTLFSLVSAVIDNYNHLDLLLKGDELILLIKSVYKKDNNCDQISYIVNEGEVTTYTANGEPVTEYLTEN